MTRIPWGILAALAFAIPAAAQDVSIRATGGCPWWVQVDPWSAHDDERKALERAVHLALASPGDTVRYTVTCEVRVVASPLLGTPVPEPSPPPEPTDTTPAPEPEPPGPGPAPAPLPTDITPPPPGDARVIFDTRASLQAAQHWDDVIGLFSDHFGGGLGWTRDVDGNGTAALFGAYTKATEANQVTGGDVTFRLDGVTDYYLQYRMRLGRSPTGDAGPGSPRQAIGEIDAFEPNAPSWPGKGQKKWRSFARGKYGPERRTEVYNSFHWNGKAPNWVEGDPLASSPNEVLMNQGAGPHGSLRVVEEQVGKIVTLTFLLEGSSGIANSDEDSSHDVFVRDGRMAFWMGERKYIDVSGLAVPDVFDRMKIFLRMNSSEYHQTEYIWDLVAWRPEAR